MDLNLRAPFLLTQSFARVLEDRPGKVVNISDWRAVYPGRKYLAYTLSKSALLTFTLMAARELAPRVQVNALALGAVLPPPGKDEAYLQRLVGRTPARRPAKLQEVTDALLFLLRNDYVTGETILVDGGAHLVHG
jgi:pteridine reductase